MMMPITYHLHPEPGVGHTYCTIIAAGLAPEMSTCTSTSPTTEAACRVELPR